MNVELLLARRSNFRPWARTHRTRRVVTLVVIVFATCAVAAVATSAARVVSKSWVERLRPLTGLPLPQNDFVVAVSPGRKSHVLAREIEDGGGNVRKAVLSRVVEPGTILPAFGSGGDVDLGTLLPAAEDRRIDVWGLVRGADGTVVAGVDVLGRAPAIGQPRARVFNGLIAINRFGSPATGFGDNGLVAFGAGDDDRRVFQQLATDPASGHLFAFARGEGGGEPSSVRMWAVTANGSTEVAGREVLSHAERTFNLAATLARDGRVYLAGSAANVKRPGDAHPLVIALTRDGSRVTSFGRGGVAIDTTGSDRYAYPHNATVSLAIDTKRRIYVLQHRTLFCVDTIDDVSLPSCAVVPATWSLRRLTRRGQIDRRFNRGRSVSLGSATPLAANGAVGLRRGVVIAGFDAPSDRRSQVACPGTATVRVGAGKVVSRRVRRTVGTLRCPRDAGMFRSSWSVDPSGQSRFIAGFSAFSGSSGLPGGQLRAYAASVGAR